MRKKHSKPILNRAQNSTFLALIRGVAAIASAASRSRGAVGLAGQRVVELKEDELKRPGQALMGKSGVGPSDSESARGWPDFVRGRPWCMSFSQLGLHGQS